MQDSGCKEGGRGDKKEMVVGVNICGCNEEMSFDDLIVKKQSAVPTSSFDEPPGKQARRNPAALINNILWIISKIKYIV